MVTPVAAARSPWAVAADIVDPPEWQPVGRPDLEPHQLPPPALTQQEADLWLLEGGRGSGKTEACARYFTKWMRQHPGHRGRIIAPTLDDAVESCMRGPSGLLQVDPEVRMVTRPGGTYALWPNGSEAILLGTYTPKDVERLRASGNRHIDWWEEMAANRQLKAAWDQAAFGLRLGEFPHAIGSTTPRSTMAYKAVRDMDETVRTQGTIFQNPHLNEKKKQALIKQYEGTRTGRQELYGELVDDVPGALWNRDMFDRSRVDEPVELVVVAVAVDPAASHGPDSDDTGIVAGGLGINGHVYIMLDRTCHLSPNGWGTRAVNTYNELEGDGIIGEVNNGGEMVQHVIRTVPGGSRVPFKAVHASRGKRVRAQPVASLMGSPEMDLDELAAFKPEVHIVGSLPELEDQCCNWDPDSGDDSPDRLDAMVWLVTGLLLEDEDEDEVVEHYDPVKIGADL